MSKQRNFTKCVLLIVLVLLVVVGLSTCKKSTADSGKRTITIMTNVYEPEPMSPDSPVLAKLEELTGYNVDITWVPSTTYNEKFNIMLASGDIPNMVLAAGISPSVINACRSGAFWEIGPYLKDYPNLSQAHEVVLNNSSIDGKVYGLYRRRNLGRNGVIYRADWLENIGMSEVVTIDDFYNMLYGFTYKDPDGNGKDDTYGMVCVQYNGPWKISLVWFGAPNEWGEDASGQLVPAHYTDEYVDCLKFWKKLYDEKLINEDFAAFDNGKWDDPIIAEKAGVKVDVLDTGGRWETKFENAGVDAKIGFAGTITGPKGPRALPTSGFNGMYMISKTSVKTVDDLKDVLNFMDKLGNKEVQDLLGWGIEGRHYNLVDGFIDPEPVEKNPELKKELTNGNQLLCFIPNIGTQRKTTEVRDRANKIMEENEKYVVGNPALPLMSSSEVYGQMGPQLDQMIEDARVQFIAGQIDMDGWKAAIETWKKSGGEDLVKEINELYAESKS